MQPSDFQSPEPWSGHLAIAPILFLSSNPSIGITNYEQYPRATWDDQKIQDYFEARFGGSPLSSVSNGIYDHLPGGDRAADWTRYWAGVKARAAELLDRPPYTIRPGHDYALSEVVRCKSVKEIGADEAAITCADRYLDRTLEESAAKVIVVMGAIAENEFRRRYQLGWNSPVYGAIPVCDRDRFVVFLPHPNRRTVKKSLANNLTPTDLLRVRQWLLT